MKHAIKILFFLFFTVGNVVFAQQIQTKVFKLKWVDNVDFERLSLSNSPLKDVNLSNSNIDHLKTDLISIKGITIDKFQTVEICNLLGVNVI